MKIYNENIEKYVKIFKNRNQKTLLIKCDYIALNKNRNLGVNNNHESSLFSKLSPGAINSITHI